MAMKYPAPPDAKDQPDGTKLAVTTLFSFTCKCGEFGWSGRSQNDGSGPIIQGGLTCPKYTVDGTIDYTNRLWDIMDAKGVWHNGYTSFVEALKAIGTIITKVNETYDEYVYLIDASANPIAYIRVTRVYRQDPDSFVKRSVFDYVLDVQPKTPVDLSAYAKKTDLQAYAQQSELTEYSKKSELTEYAKKTELNEYAKKTDIPTFDPTGYISKKEFDDHITEEMDTYATQSSLENYALRDSLNKYLTVEESETFVTGPDLDNKLSEYQKIGGQRNLELLGSTVYIGTTVKYAKGLWNKVVIVNMLQYRDKTLHYTVTMPPIDGMKVAFTAEGLTVVLELADNGTTLKYTDGLGVLGTIYVVE